MVRLHVRYRPLFFADDARLVVSLDGKVIHDAPASRGVDRVQELLFMGEHYLDTALHVGREVRTRRYRLDLTTPAHQRGGVALFVARLRYNGLWGNFTRRLACALTPWRSAAQAA